MGSPSTIARAAWPRTISQLDNYSPPSWGKLNEVTLTEEDAVVQLVDSSSGDVLYTVRANGKTFTPHAPKGRSFTIKTGSDSAQKVVAENVRVAGN